MFTYRICGLLLLTLSRTEEVNCEDDVQEFMQVHASTLKTASVLEPEALSSVQVHFSLEDAESGQDLFEAHPALLQKRGQTHLGDAKTSGLRLKFSAHGHSIDLMFQKRRGPLARDATLTVGTSDGDQHWHLRDRHIYAGPHAILTSVGDRVVGLVRRGTAYLDLELTKGQSLLTVSTGKSDEEYLKAAAEVAAQKPLSLPERWTDCYENDGETHALGMGVAMGSKLYSRFSTKDEAIDYVVQIFGSANLIYRPQLNFVLVCRMLHLQISQTDAPDWDQGETCPFGIDTQLHRFDKWDPPGSKDVDSKGQGIWTLLDDCFKSGTIGLAYVGTICQMEKNYWGQRPNTAVVWHNFRTWITFAHETGHIFGGEHSFELGQGTTGGIMDYGDGQLDGKFQFNTQFRKKKMCQTMDQVVKNKCGAIWLFDGECGNGILTDQEECECADGSKNCTYCKDCTLDANKFCTPDGYGVHPIGLGVGTGDCCTQNGTFRKSGSFCHVPGVGNGYCTAGLCIPSKCSDYHFVGDFCGLQAQNECKFMCMDQNHACSTMDGWLVRQEPANYVRDQVPCNWRRGSDGICMKGSCVPAVEGCGNSLHEEGEQCECQDGSRTCRFCSDCKLEKGKDCSPDDENGACCSKDGFFKDGECIWNGVKGYCMQGRCQDTPCSTYKSWDGWGEFCGLQEGNSCKFKCEVHGTCDTLEKFLLAGQPMNQFPDGTPCSLKGGFGSCKDGQCQVIEEVKEEEHQGAKSEVVDLQPGGEKADTWNHHEGVNDEDLEDQEAPPDSTECGECLNGVNCNIIRARSSFTKSCEEIEKDFGCDCSSCSACAEEQQPKEKYQGCEKTCGGILWWAKSCDTHIWNARVQGHKGHARTTCKGLKNRWNCNCDGCLLCEEEFDEAKMME